MRLLVIALLILTGLIGCTQQSTSGGGGGSGTTGTAQPPESGTSPKGGGAPSLPSDSMGTGHSGGGNGLDGIALENHKFKVNELPAYKNVLEPLFVELRQTLPDFATDLENVFNRKIWHMSTKPLATIASENLSVAFATEQLALQNIYEVWLDKTAFDKMTEEQQATLLIHEAFMGIKIALNIEYRKMLTPDYMNPLERIKNAGKTLMEIDRVDYEQIRTMTTRLMEAQFKEDLQTFIGELESMNFGTYVSKERMNTLSDTYGREFTTDEIISFFQSGIDAGTLPTTCKYTLAASAKKIQFAQVKDADKKTEIALSDEKSKTTISRNGVVIVSLIQEVTQNIGNVRFNVKIEIKDDQIRSIQVVQEIYIFDLKGFSWREKGNTRVMCPAQ